MDVHSQRTVSGEQVQSGRFVWLPWLIGKHNSYQDRLHWPDPCSIVHLYWWLQLTQCQYCNIATHVPYAEWQKRTSASFSGRDDDKVQNGHAVLCVLPSLHHFDHHLHPLQVDGRMWVWVAGLMEGSSSANTVPNVLKPHNDYLSGMCKQYPSGLHSTVCPTA